MEIPRKLGMTEQWDEVIEPFNPHHPERSDGSPAIGTYSVHARALDLIRNLMFEIVPSD